MTEQTTYRYADWRSIMIHEPIVIDFLKLVLDFSERNHCLEAEVPK